jgi:4-hydroxy-tetrahydrodipicolinate synthase
MPATRREFLGTAAAALATPAGAATLPAGEQRFLIAALTMLDGKGQFDPSLQRDYLRFLEKGGAEGALILGTTGEFASFSVKERKAILESSVKHKGGLEIMAQVTTPNLPETLDLLDHAASAGAGSALVLPPFYYKNLSTDSIVAFYEPVLRAARLPVLLYNIPQLSGVPITAELLDRLSSHDRLAGVKDSFSKAEDMTAMIRKFPKLRMLTGVTGNIATNLKEGGAGVITGNGSIFLKETLAIFAAHRSGGDAAAAQSRFNEAAKAVTGYAGVPAMKYALSLRGLRESGYRPPFLPLTAEQKRALAARLSA